MKKQIKNLLKKLALNYKIPDSFFIRYLNFRMRLHKDKKYMFRKNDNPDITPRYKIVDLTNGMEKYFSFRDQGLMAFGEGIVARGELMGYNYMLDKIVFEPGDVIIDVGANTGDLKIYFENKNVPVQYYGFEPGKEEFKALRLNNKTDCVLNVALGDSNGRATFYYKPEYGDSSLVEMSGYSSSYEVEVKKLSSIFEELNLTTQKIKLLKLEAEGFEPEILTGLGPYYANIMYISADLGFERGVNKDTTAPQVLNYIIPKGFEIAEVTKGERFGFLLRNTILCS